MESAPNIEVTPNDELEKILEQQQREIEWWADKPSMQTSADIEAAIESGEAVRVPDQGRGYKLSAKILPEFRTLETKTLELLTQISSLWLQKIKSAHISDEDVFLVISSLARTEEFQQQLIAQGYPAAEKSTHTKLGAFDIAVKWFETNAPQMKSMLVETLDELSKQYMFNVIPEPTIGVLHIALDPR